MTDKKILFVLPRMGGGGAERVVALVSNALAQRGNDVTIYTLVGGDSFYPLDERVNYKSLGVTVNRSSKLKLLWSKASFFGKSFFSIRRLIKNEKYDAVISFLIETDILVGLCNLSGLRFNHVCSERNDPTKRSGLLLKFLNAIYKRASLFVCQSQMVAKFYKAVPDSVKIVIPNPVEPKNLPERGEVKNQRIVAVGKLRPQKNFKMLINSFYEVHKDFPQATLDIYGEGELRGALQQQINSLNLDKCVTLCGAHKKVMEQIADAELFIMSSDYEGFPNVLLEAIAVGLPVVSTNFPTGVAMELVGEDNGMVVPTDDAAAMADAIRHMLADKQRLIAMGRNNRELAKKYYTEVIIEKWEEALTEIM